MVLCLNPLVPCWYIGKGLTCVLTSVLSLVRTVHYRSFFGESFRIFYVRDHVICEQRQLHFFLFSLYTFCSFYRTGEGFQCHVEKQWREGRPCVVPYKVRGKALSFSPVSLMLAVCSRSIFFIKLRKFSPTPSLLRVSVMNGNVLGRGISEQPPWGVRGGCQVGTASGDCCCVQEVCPGVAWYPCKAR